MAWSWVLGAKHKLDLHRATDPRKALVDVPRGGNHVKRLETARIEPAQPIEIESPRRMVFTWLMPVSFSPSQLADGRVRSGCPSPPFIGSQRAIGPRR